MDVAATGFTTEPEAAKIVILAYLVMRQKLKEKSVAWPVDVMNGTHGAHTVPVIMGCKPKVERAKMQIQLFQPVAVKLRPDIAE